MPTIQLKTQPTNYYSTNHNETDILPQPEPQQTHALGAGDNALVQQINTDHMRLIIKHQVLSLYVLMTVHTDDLTMTPININSLFYDEDTI